MVDSERLRRDFQSLYGTSPRLFSAPGRVNLIGEHTDYNDGFVLPMAIEPRTFVAAGPGRDSRVRARSVNLDRSIELDLASPGPRQNGSWSAYVEGTAQALLARGFAIQGADLLIESDVPAGAGLSASAALELAVAHALVSLSGVSNPDRVELALAGQSAEHTYVGTLCGIMDQYIVALGQPAHALLIDCRSLAFTAVPVRLGTACLLICDTTVKHQLASSAYNDRRRQCEAGVALLARQLPNVRALRDVSADQLEEHARHLPDLIAKRCRHVVRENARTLEAATLLEAGRLAELGALMCASHVSLQRDYEVSCVELDEAVEASVGEAGVYGARMTGGGFGGCAVVLLEQSAVERVMAAIVRRFSARFGATPQFLLSQACAGVRED